MNRRELAELRRRLRPDKNNITHIYGCYVNGARERVADFDESMGLLSGEEAELYMGLLKKTLSGALGRNLISVQFASKQVVDSDEHRLLSGLRKSCLEDAALRQTLYDCIINTLDAEEGCNYLILLAYDAYDVTRKRKDGGRDDSTDVFRYILCCVCPVKSKKAELRFDTSEKKFMRSMMDQLVCPPRLGFMFPSFDDRTANIYSTLFYTRDTEQLDQSFIDAVFHTPAPLSAGAQRDSFHTVLSEALDRECSFELVQSVHEQLSELVSAHKESRSPESLELSVFDAGTLLENCGASPEKAEEFRKKYSEKFGADAMLIPANLAGGKSMEICTPEVKVTVEPQFGYLVQKKLVDGKLCIVISVDGGVEINGVNVDL